MERECGCPYCDGMTDTGVCAPCGVKLVLCPDCATPQPREATVCAACGAALSQQDQDKE